MVAEFLQTIKLHFSNDQILLDSESVRLQVLDSGLKNQVPLAIVFPDRVEQIQHLVREASRMNIQLRTVGRGQNWGYGGSSVIGQNSVLVSLERLNKIIEINEKLAYAVVEPGVTYEQLNCTIKEKGLKVMADCTDGTPNGSVLGNALDRGIGETPYGDHFSNLCELKVVLPNGDLISTSASHDNGESQTKHLYKAGFGPSMNGLFSQSSFGIVVSASIWLMRRPDYQVTYSIELKNPKNLALVLDLFREMALTGLMSTKLHFANDFVVHALINDQNTEAFDYLIGEERQKILDRDGLVSWSGYSAIYGTSGGIRAARREIKRRLRPYCDLRFFGERQMRWINSFVEFCHDRPWLQKLFRRLLGKSTKLLAILPQAHRILGGEPTEFFLRHAYFKIGKGHRDAPLRPGPDGVGLHWIAPVLPFDGHKIEDFARAVEKIFEVHQFEFYSALMATNPRSIIQLMGIFYDKADAAETKRAHELVLALRQEVVARKLILYRSGPLEWPDILPRHSQRFQLLKNLKRALDPHQILAPGHYGI